MVKSVAKESVCGLMNAEQAFFDSLIKISSLENNMGCVDGKIIGTGRPDYTQSSTEYHLVVKDNEFLLIDIPGIEGDEGKYRQIIKESLLKAHVIFYVNGSGKKAEKETLEKIRDYMHDGTSVYAVFNVHCKAKKNRIPGVDKTYQEELTEAYIKQEEIVRQTEMELKSFLGKNFKGSISLNGLLSFCAMAWDGGCTTIIDQECDKNLRREQEKFLKEYTDDFERMGKDSRISEVQNIIAQRVDRFDEYILEENIKKLKTRLSDIVSDIQTLSDREATKIRGFMREYDAFERNCTTAKEDFIHAINRIGRSEVATAFIPVLEELYTAIEKAEGKLSDSTVEQVFERHQSQISFDIKNNVNQKMQAAVEEYQEDIQEAENRLFTDLQRTQKKFEIEMSADKLYFASSFKDCLNLDIKDFAKGALRVANYIFEGFRVGTIFPVLGNIIGAIAGLFCGIFMEIWRFFASKTRRINRAKERLKSEIDDQIDNITAEIKHEINNMGIKAEIEKKHREIQNSIEGQKRSLQSIEHMLNVVLLELEDRYQRI